MLLSGYFREELQQRIREEGSVPGRPPRVLLGYSLGTALSWSWESTRVAGKVPKGCLQSTENVLSDSIL